MEIRSSSPVFFNEIDDIYNKSLSSNWKIEEYLRSGDLPSIKVLFNTNPNIYIDKNLIVDCSKGLNELPFNKMSIYGSILKSRFKAWKYIIERLNRNLSEQELEAIINVANILYKDINWTHPFWKEISVHNNINNYAKKWIQYRTQ